MEIRARSRTDAQWAYGAILDHWSRWGAARATVRRKKPRVRGSRALAFALAAATSAAPRAP